jgi:phosphatidylserine/phosphatidylglycerophosphate/cardiolipin synthase-like enzyme
MTVRSTSGRTPPDRVVTSVADRRNTILEVIRNARRSIALSLFRCNDPQIFSELGQAAARGVHVDALITSRAKGDKSDLKELWAALQQTGASVHAYTDPVVKYHAKYLVADDGPAVVASFNFTKKCFERTCDALVLTHDPEVVEGLLALMAADRDRRPLPATVSPRLIIGPERARRQFTVLIEQASSSLRLIDPKLSDPDLVTLLNARHGAGLKVEVFGSKRLGNLKSHGKILLIDDRIAVVGGLALAAISLDFRREVAIVVEDPGAVAEVKELFRTIDAVPTAGRPRTPDARGLAL